MSAAGGSEQAGEYDVPRPTKIKLKETKADKAERVFRREQRRYRKEQERISRANGYAVSPPRARGDSESMSPPRKQARRRDDSPGYAWMGGRGRAAVQELKQREERREEEERFAWLAQEEMSRGDPFAEYADPHIPRRFKQPMASSSKRDVARELESGAVPSIGRMTEEEYAEWIRNGMYRLKHKEEYAQREREKEAKLQKEIEREKAREEAERRERRHERKRREALRLEEAKKEEEAKAQSAHDLQQERERYQARWTSITSTGEVEETQLAFEDIPWPIYKPITLDNLTKDRIRTFLHAQGGDVRKVLRETIRSFHPDRFFGRILPRVRASDADEVRQGVETCSRIINDLLRE